jgi:hypothetical protein
MSEDLSEFHLDEMCVYASGLCTGGDNPRLSHMGITDLETVTVVE